MSGRDRRVLAVAVAGTLAIGLALGTLVASAADESPHPVPAVTRTVIQPRATVTVTVTAPPQGTLPDVPSPVPVVSGNG